MPRATKSVAAPKKAGGTAAVEANATKATKASKNSKAVPAEPQANDATVASEARAKASGKKAASARKPVPEPAATTDKFLEEQRSLLLSERADYVRQAEMLKAEAEQLAADMEPGDIQFDEESGEGGTMNIERERDLALSAQARAAVDEIDRALAKLETGTYGICERCGEPIKRARLKVLPHAALCIACKSGGLSRR
ncbi:MAG: TraR/DksA C4-type zinc finger protein [Acidimicrobiales bacterium]